MSHIRRVSPLIAAAAMLLSSTALHADLPPINDLPVLLKVNLSNLSAVTFTATGAFSYADDGVDESTGHWIGSNGILLTGFFKDPVHFVLAYGTPGSDLRHSGFKPAEEFGDSDFYQILTAGYPHIPSYYDNAMHVTGGYSYDAQKFRTNLPAFIGTLTVDFSALDTSYIALLQDVGQVGYIYSGYGEGAVLIGTWTVVVPEPSTTVITMMGTLLLAGLYHHHRSSKIRS